MKALSELDISPWPWRTKSYQTIDEEWMVLKSETSQIGSPIASSLCEENARLIAAAPELYEALREAVTESCQAYCAKTADEPCHKKCGECFVQKWRSALAKASGESANNQVKDIVNKEEK